MIFWGFCLASFLWFVKICSNIVLKVADLWKCTRRPHGNMIFDVLAPRTLLIFSWFSVFSHSNFRLILGLILGCILAVLGLNFWSFWRSKGCQNVSKNRCDNWHRKKCEGMVFEGDADTGMVFALFSIYNFHIATATTARQRTRWMHGRRGLEFLGSYGMA